MHPSFPSCLFLSSVFFALPDLTSFMYSSFLPPFLPSFPSSHHPSFPASWLHFLRASFISSFPSLSLLSALTLVHPLLLPCFLPLFLPYLLASWLHFFLAALISSIILSPLPPFLPCFLPCILRISLLSFHASFPANLSLHRLRTILSCVVSACRLARVTFSASASWHVISAENFTRPATWRTSLAWTPKRKDVRFRFAVAPSNVSLFCPACVSKLCSAFVCKLSFDVTAAVALGNH